MLVALDDSASALAAAALAIEFATSRPTELMFVTVAEAANGDDAVLSHVAELARNAGVASTISTTRGDEPFEALLAAAHGWRADVIVMGRSHTRRPGDPYVGSQTEHLLEFTDIPVLVVPEPS